MYLKSSMTWDNYFRRLHYTFSLSSEFPMLALFTDACRGMKSSLSL